jgi:hypothetical protein
MSIIYQININLNILIEVLKIDVLLSELYGFSQDEVDFIVNYDIKYRMGGADEGDAS